MARKVDPALTRQAINWLRRARTRAEGSDAGVTEWEDEFLASVEERLERYGSAFTDPDKGQLSAPLSLRQGLKVRQIGKRGVKSGSQRLASKDRADGTDLADSADDAGVETTSKRPQRPVRAGDKAGFKTGFKTGSKTGGKPGGKTGGLARRSGLSRKSPLRARKPGPDRG